MTEHAAEKRAARRFARENFVSYRTALTAVRAQRVDVAQIAPFAQRLLIEAVEGCGIRHWARVNSWDGAQCVTITDLGGEVYRLTIEGVAPMVADYRDSGVIESPLDVDSYLADEIIQSILFGGVIYRSEVRKRPAMIA